ncbi:polysaccharide export protein [Phialemonium atrogriseum]|uniref:Polysaccharide export protein n=1 Tax=Phialemonium atrogriseum TaxID=1093897 RepID=A0AAJ0BUJ5_9PEZI|nr:polysaccharide export protein [Phialemonium atrogriseum]KAK1764560.1 polysaccharide export protein [Phialemonium atrogriseum]
MLLKPRLPRRLPVYLRHALAILVLFSLIDALLLISGRPYTDRDPTHHAVPPEVSVFIVSVHRNNEAVLRAAWNDAVMRLASRLGPRNVHFSAVEGGSQDGTKAALMELKGRLDDAGVANSISLGMNVWEQVGELSTRPDPLREREPGWIWNKEDGHYDMRRIPYLARVRNQAMEPLKMLERKGRRFDKVLWLNDVVFDTEDFLTLLNTRDGHYAAACSMDFKDYPYYYDTFALRDELGQKTASDYWPWFASATARASARKAEPVEVFSCWNGMVLFDSTPFYADPPLRFRGIDDSLADLHLEASECCLIHADNVLSRDPGKGVWLNPNVRVGYTPAAYGRVKGGRFPGPSATVVGAWSNRWSRLRAGVQFSLETRAVRSRLKKWGSETPAGELTRAEPGEPCLINEMQIMWQNGWRHL